MSHYDAQLELLTSYSSGAVDWAYIICQQSNISPDVVFSWSDDDLMRAIVALRWRRIVEHAQSIASADPKERIHMRTRSMRKGIDGKRAAKLSRVL